jgi:CheY-like chemotaxis protein
MLKDPSRVPPERFARSLAGIRRSAEELLRTAEAVLDLSRLDDPAVKAPAEPIDLADTVREAVDNLQPLAERKQIGLRMTIQPGVPATLMTNGQHVRQVVMNLVANAIKFTLQGEVVVRVHRLGAQAAVDVADTGIGIPEASRARIFEPFFQVNRSAAQKMGGSGVGLALAKRFAEGLGGDLSLLATTEGLGSTFRFTLPLDPASIVIEVATDTEETTPVLPVRVRPLEGLRVLVADDEELVLDALCKLLETAGATVGRATDGEQAMEKALDQDFALILMDVRMPILDGLGATSRLRAAGFWRPIVALTASATADQRAACIAAGCNDHLTKPIAASDLVSKVAAVCRRLT